MVIALTLHPLVGDWHGENEDLRNGVVFNEILLWLLLLVEKH